MKLLVIGGSYFYGRVFVMEAAKEHDITVWNRGTYSMKEFGVREVRADRHEQPPVCGEDYDAVVDFCAYKAGDVRTTLEHLTGKTGQYILISTVDVYEGIPIRSKQKRRPLRNACSGERRESILREKSPWSGNLRRSAKSVGFPAQRFVRPYSTALIIMHPENRLISACFYKIMRCPGLRMQTGSFSLSM